MGSKFDLPHFVMHGQHLHIVHLMIPLAADIMQRRILRRIMTNQQEKIKKELDIMQFEGHERTEENYETPHSE